MSEERCEACGSDGILNRDLPLEDQYPIFTRVEFRGDGTPHREGLTYFLKRVCSDCNNRWQSWLIADIDAAIQTPIDTPWSQNCKRRVLHAETALESAKRMYLDSLAEDDRVGQVAFLLFTRDCEDDPEWEGEVTWEHWHTLQVESERDKYRKLAAEMYRLVEEGLK